MERPRHFENYTVGEVRKTPGRTITETDNTWFTLLTMNTHPMHFDKEYAKASEFGKVIVCSPLTVALMVGMSVTDVSQKAVANLGWDEVRFPKPVFVGDTLHIVTEVLELRASKSRPDAGIVTFLHQAFNQRGELVASCKRSGLQRKRPA